jgi:hypothetical protein
VSDSSGFMPVVPIRRLRLMSYGAAVLGYLLLVSLAFQSIVFNLSTAIPGIKGGNPDFALFYWDLWWFQHAILQLGRDPFYTNYILFPHTLNLAYHTFAPFLGLLAIPISALFNWPATVNILLVGSLMFSGVVLFAFLRHHTVPAGLAFLGGALFIFNSFSTLRVSFLHLDMLPMGWLPAGLLATDGLIERRTWPMAIALAVIVYAAALTDQLFAIWLPIVLVPYFIYRLVRSEAVVRRRVVAMAVVAAIVLLGLLLVAPLPQWLAGRSAQYPVATLRNAQVRSMQVTDIVALPPRFAYSEIGTLGFLLPIGVVIGLFVGRGERDRIFWLIIGLLGLTLALGPTLQPIGLPLPYQLLHLFTGGLFRVPARFILVAILGLIIFVAFSLRSFYARLPRATRWAFVASVLILLAIENQWYEPFPAFSMPDYRIYHAIANEPDEFTVLEVPIGPDNTIADKFGRGTELQYYATIHQKRLINGSVSRAPIGTTHDYRQWPLITALAEEGPIPGRDAARAELKRLSDEWDIRYVIMHREMLSPDLANWSVGFFNTQPGWCLVDEEGPLLAYRRLESGVCPRPDLLELPADGVLRIGDGSDDRYLGLGWYPAENVGGPQARWTGEVPTSTLRVKLAARAYRVTLQATAYPVGQKLTVEANGQRAAEFAVSEGWNEYAFDLPADLIGPDGMTTLTLTPAHAESAYERTGGQVDDRRPLAVAYDAITLAPK